MTRQVLSGVLVALAVLILPRAAEATCVRTVAASMAPVTPGRIDQQHLAAAILAEVNYRRCEAGRAPVELAGPRLLGVAREHSRWMAGTKRLSHVSTVPGQKRLSSRLDSAQIPIRRAAENIATVPRMHFRNRPFVVRDRGSCRFVTRAGDPVQPHNYGTLAYRVVELWMASQSHRRNLLDPRVRRMSAAAAYSDDRNCGRFWVTQVFVG